MPQLHTKACRKKSYLFYPSRYRRKERKALKAVNETGGDDDMMFLPSELICWFESHTHQHMAGSFFDRRKRACWVKDVTHT